MRVLCLVNFGLTASYALPFSLPCPLVFAHVSLCSLTLLEKFVVRAVPHKILVLRRA